MMRKRSFVTNMLIKLIEFYQKDVSPGLPARCRFVPTCSQYAKEALLTHGFFRGTMYALWRFLRCNPLCKGGYDPIPAPKVRK